MDRQVTWTFLAAERGDRRGARARAGGLLHARRGPGRPRRGVASVLAMMFLVIFGSLAAAMAVVAQGNLRTADSSMRVSRAMSAAEAGLVFAANRMNLESRRFVVKRGVIDAAFAELLWLGTINPGDVTVLPPTGYPPPASPPPGIIQAIRDAHLADSHGLILETGDSALPSIDNIFGILVVRPIALEATANAPYFRLRYELLDTLPMVRVTSVGYDGSVSRTLQLDYSIDKKIEYAILANSRIMIGKNVLVEGPLGSRYGVNPATGLPNPDELGTGNGDPLVMRSDFYFLDLALDTILDTFFATVVADDVDGDGRLRPGHVIEGRSLVGLPQLVDYDSNEYIDDFDLFLAYFDANVDGRLCYDGLLAAAAGLGVLPHEFDNLGVIIDGQLCRLIDLAVPDRDYDGIEATASDVALGYRDGVLDAKDLYAKVHGGLAFAVARADWEAAHGLSYQTVVEGSISPGLDTAAVAFEVAAEELLEIDMSMFNISQTWFEAQVPPPLPRVGGDPPQDPAVLAGLAIVPGIFTPIAAAPWEPVPFGSAGAYDHYQRPVYENMTFRNVRIPTGNNGLFINCTFVGVTFIETYTNIIHRDWNYAGSFQPDGVGGFELRFPDLPPVGDPILIDGVGPPITVTRDWSNSLRFHDCTFLGSVAADRVGEYTHWRNKVQMTGATRWYVDSADVEPPTLADAGGFLYVDYLNAILPADLIELRKSSMLLPGWSVDVGSFTNEVAGDPNLTPTVNLQGVIITGLLDVRGTANVSGTLLMTFRPTKGAGPLSYGGQPDAFNTTIGYFEPTDGDEEGGGVFEGYGEIRLRYDPDALLPDGVPWPVRMAPVPDTYSEGGTG